MNAFEQVKSLAMISKVEAMQRGLGGFPHERLHQEAIAYLFRSEFPNSIADLKPWIHNEETKKFCDPNSIDLAFYFHHTNFSCKSQNILMQVKIHQDSNRQKCQAIGIKLLGYAAYQEQWQFFTNGYWEFFGRSKPTIATQVKLKNICRQILNLFNGEE